MSNDGMFDSRATYIMERRHEDGPLDLQGEQPSKLFWSEREITDYYFRNNLEEGDDSATQEGIIAWFKREKGWTWRRRTW